MMKTLMTLFFLCSPLLVLGQEPNPMFFLKNAAELELKYHFGSLFFSEQITEEDISKFVKNGKKGFFSEQENSKSFAGGNAYSYENYLIVPISKQISKGEIYSLHIREKSTDKVMNLFIRSAERMGYGYTVGLDQFQFKEGNYFYDFCRSKRKYKVKKYNGEKQRFLNFQNRPELNQLITIEAMKKHEIQIDKLNKILKK